LPSAGPVAAPGSPFASPLRSAADVRAARKDAARLERRMLRLDADEKALHERLAAAAADYAQAAELDAQLRALQAEKEQVEAEWLAAAEVAEG
jgi:ABC transport system ATP-binding/permease protein